MVDLIVEKLGQLAEPEAITRYRVNIPNGDLGYRHVNYGLTPRTTAIDLGKLLLVQRLACSQLSCLFVHIFREC